MRSIEPGIHQAAKSAVNWIPGSRFARPGMTAENEAATATYKKLWGSTSTSSLRLPDGFGQTASQLRR